MGWTRSEAEALLRRAFPWGTHVRVQSGSEFLAVRYEVLEEGLGDDHALLRFERDPGNTLQGVSRKALEEAAISGVLELDGDVRARRPEVSDLHLLASPFRDLIGPQSPGETVVRIT